MSWIRMRNGLMAVCVVMSLQMVIGCEDVEGDPASDVIESGSSVVMTDDLGNALGDVSKEVVISNEDNDMNLLARVEVQDNELLEFYEPAPGTILLSGAGAPSRPVMFTENIDLNVSEIWQLATHDAPMPTALKAAVDRQIEAIEKIGVEAPLEGLETPEVENGMIAAAAASLELEKEVVGGPENIVESKHAVWGGWCQTSYYTSYISGYGGRLGDCGGSGGWWDDFTVCWDTVTGYGAAWHHDALDMRTNVCSVIGSVIMKVSADESWVPRGSWTVPEDTYRWVTAFDPGCDAFPWTNDCPYIKSEVLNNSSVYNYRFEVEER